jgi:hypothetical protein
MMRQMRIVELYGGSRPDFTDALKKAIGAPDWHGCSMDAFPGFHDYHDDINALKSPYPIPISGIDKAKPEAHDANPPAGSVD